MYFSAFCAQSLSRSVNKMLRNQPAKIHDVMRIMGGGQVVYVCLGCVCWERVGVSGLGCVWGEG